MCKEGREHWWLIAENVSPQSKGVCQHCEEERVFFNLPRDLCMSTRDYIHRHQAVTFDREILGIMR